MDLPITIPKENKERVLGEMVAVVIGAGGCMLGIYEYTSTVFDKVKNVYQCIEELGGGDVLCDDRFGSQRFYDGDISAVKYVAPAYGITARHVYEMAGRNARRLEQRIEERLKAGEKDEIVEALSQDRIEDFTLILCIATVSGAGYVICRRLAKFANLKKPFGGVVRLLNLPSILEPGVEDTLTYFLDEGEYAGHVKTIIVSTDVAYLIYKNMVLSPNLRVARDLRASTGDPKRLLSYVRKISFEGVDYIISQIYGLLFLGSLVRDLRLLHEGNVKRLDSADILNFLGRGTHYIVSAFSTNILDVHPDLDDVVTLGATVPMVPGESQAFLEEYSVVLPSRISSKLRKIQLSHKRGRVRGIALSSILDDYNIGIAFIKVDWNRFKNLFKEFIGVI